MRELKAKWTKKWYDISTSNDWSLEKTFIVHKLSSQALPWLILQSNQTIHYFRFETMASKKLLALSLLGTPSWIVSNVDLHIHQTHVVCRHKIFIFCLFFNKASSLGASNWFPCSSMMPNTISRYCFHLL